MRGGRALIGILTVGLLLALVFYQVDVPSIKPHEGAVAYTQPTVKSTYIASASTSGLATEPSIAFGAESVTPSIEIVSHKYTAPAPVKRPLWQAILGPASLTGGTPIGNISKIVPTPGVTCSVTSDKSRTFNVNTYIKVEVLEPMGDVASYTTDQVTWKVSERVQRTTCSDASTFATMTHIGEEVTYKVGSYYYTKGYGDYRFTVTVMMHPESGADFQVGKASLAVSVTPDSLV